MWYLIRDFIYLLIFRVAFRDRGASPATAPNPTESKCKIYHRGWIKSPAHLSPLAESPLAWVTGATKWLQPFEVQIYIEKKSRMQRLLVSPWQPLGIPTAITPIVHPTSLRPHFYSSGLIKSLVMRSSWGWQKKQTTRSSWFFCFVRVSPQSGRQKKAAEKANGLNTIVRKKWNQKDSKIP